METVRNAPGTRADAGRTIPIQAGSTPLRQAFVQIRRGWQLYLLFSLPLAYILLFKYVPMYGAQIAFRDYVVTQGIWGSEWVGFENFTRFFRSREFWRLLGNTLGLSLYQLLAGFPLPILLALSLNQVRQRFFKATVQMVTYAPHFISVVVLVGMIFQVLDPRVGIVNQILKLLGVEPINFMGQPGYFSSIYVWSGVWQHVGFSAIILLPSIQRCTRRRWWMGPTACNASGTSTCRASCPSP